MFYDFRLIEEIGIYIYGHNILFLQPYSQGIICMSAQFIDLDSKHLALIHLIQMKTGKWFIKAVMLVTTDYGRPVRKSPSLHGQKSNPNPKFLGTAEAYFACHIGPKFHISLIYAFIGCPQSVYCVLIIAISFLLEYFTY